MLHIWEDIKRFRSILSTSLFMNIPCPTIHEGSAWFLNKITANGNLLISIATNKGGLLHSFKPFGRAPRRRRSGTRLCKSSTFDSMRRSNGTHEASHSKHTPLAALLAAEPRYRNLSFSHSFLTVASLTRYCRLLRERLHVIWFSPPAEK